MPSDRAHTEGASYRASIGTTCQLNARRTVEVVEQQTGEDEGE